MRESVFKIKFRVLAGEFESIETSPGFAWLLDEFKDIKNQQCLSFMNWILLYFCIFYLIMHLLMYLNLNSKIETKFQMEFIRCCRFPIMRETWNKCFFLKVKLFRKSFMQLYTNTTNLYKINIHGFIKRSSKFKCDIIKA